MQAKTIYKMNVDIWYIYGKFVLRNKLCINSIKLFSHISQPLFFQEIFYFFLLEVLRISNIIIYVITNIFLINWIDKWKCIAGCAVIVRLHNRKWQSFILRGKQTDCWRIICQIIVNQTLLFLWSLLHLCYSYLSFYIQIEKQKKWIKLPNVGIQKPFTRSELSG